jgi:hypothetical protein
MSKKKMNNKWPKAPIIYKGRALRGESNRIAIDVKNFITINDGMLKEVIKKYKLDRGNKNQVAHNCQKFVVNFLTYKYDKETSNTPEFWQFPFETLQSETGDCEDGAILMASLMIEAGIPAWRVKVAAGNVKPSETAPEGGHAYCIYYADVGRGKKEWIINDWCFYEDSRLPPERKPLAKNGGYKGTYKEIWFTFNNEYSWSQTAIDVSDRVSKKQSKDIKESIGSETEIEAIISSIDNKIKK